MRKTRDELVQKARALWRELRIELSCYAGLKDDPEGLPEGCEDPDPTGELARLVQSLEDMLGRELWSVKDRATGTFHAAPSLPVADTVAWKLDTGRGGFRAEVWPGTPEDHAKSLKQWSALRART